MGDTGENNKRIKHKIFTKTSFIQHSSHSHAHKSKRSFTIPHIHPLKHDTLTLKEGTDIHSLKLNKQDK